jgi:hypothetical protein
MSCPRGFGPRMSAASGFARLRKLEREWSERPESVRRDRASAWRPAGVCFEGPDDFDTDSVSVYVGK